MDHLLGENRDLWGVMLDGPTIPMKNGIDGTTQVPKDRKEWNFADKLVIQNNAKAKKILICGIGLDEYNRISSCQDAKAIWETLQTAHEGTTQESKVEAITEARDLDKLAMNELIGNLMAYELNKKQEKEIRGKRKEKNLVLTGTTPENFEEKTLR
ncbi:uncharacterized protein [Solanum lycopersicum]|uniref:uncharacterized protein n=1 Tax=Solanum lycopersicum TaxID=4081 RepID=UPI0037493DC1